MVTDCELFLMEGHPDVDYICWSPGRAIVGPSQALGDRTRGDSLEYVLAINYPQ